MRAMAIVAAVIVMPAIARAGHDHGGHEMAMDDGQSSYSATVGLVAASFSNALYEGDYQGLRVEGEWARDRLSVGVGFVGYRLRRNGLLDHGLGDASVHAAVAVLTAHPVTAGVAAMISLPTGDSTSGFGMGHAMAMVHAWGQLTRGRFAVSGLAGYMRGVGSGVDHAQHGLAAWPLVDPMTMSEVILGGAVDLALGPGFAAGPRVGVAVPLDAGPNRVTAGLRVRSSVARFDTAFELDAGVSGEPFDVRGVVETTARF